jgi:flagellin-like protein
MNSKIPVYYEKKKKSRLKNRRGISDIIGTMMLMAVTVTGATALTYFMNDAFISGNLGTISTLDSSSMNILLLAYDTRDSFSLLTLSEIDNENIVNSFLCGITCSVTPNIIPENGGTEFIVLQIRNNGIDSVFLEDVSINNVIHSWDSLTSGIQLDASQNDLVGGKYPADGMFSILPVTNSPIIQNANNQIPSGQTVNLLVKLGSDDSDILLNRGINILLDTGRIHPVEFLIESGDAR